MTARATTIPTTSRTSSFVSNVFLTPRSYIALVAALVLTACQEVAAPRPGTPPVTVQSVQLTGAAWLLEQGSAAYAATVTGTDGRPLLDRPITWTSSDTTVLRVNAGVAYAVRPGEATLTAAADGKAAWMRLVVRPLTVDSIEVPPLPDLSAGEFRWAGVTLRAADGRPLYDRVVTWASLDPSIATVDAGGRVRGIAAGTTYLVATSEGRSGSVRVVVKPSRVNGRWTISGTALGNANTVCSVSNLHLQLTQSGMLLSGAMYYDMWTGAGPTVECTPVAGQPGPYSTPVTPSGPFTGSIAENGYAVLTSSNGWQLVGIIDRAAGTWSGTLTYVDGEPVNGIVPVRTGVFTATRH